MAPELNQVTLRFGNSMEIRYLEQPPRSGDRIDARGGKKWLVSEVVQERGVYVAECVPFRTPRERVWDVVAADLAIAHEGERHLVAGGRDSRR